MHRTIPRIARWLVGVLAMSLTGCDMGPDYHAPTLEVPAAYLAATPAGTTHPGTADGATQAGTPGMPSGMSQNAAPGGTMPQGVGPSLVTAPLGWPSSDWWRGFRSPELNELMTSATAQNFDIAAAMARVRQADAQLRIAGATLFPTLDGSGSSNWQRAGLSSRSNSAGLGGLGSGSSSRVIESRSYAVGLDTGYEIDFWGRNQASRAAAAATSVFSRFDQQTVALTVISDVATTWFTALAYADRLVVARRNLADAEQTLAVIRGRFAAGTANALDIAQQESQVAIERAVIPNLTSQLNQQVIGLGILIGRPPEAVEVRPGTLDTLVLPPVSPGLPSELLRRRPDVAAVEAQLVAQNFDIKVARAAFFPSVQLTGSAGYQAAALGTLFSPGGQILSLAAGLTLPIFDGGTLRGQLELAKGRYDELLADYRKAVIQAFTDVDLALTTWQFTSEQERLQRDAVTTARRAADIARAQMTAGLVDVTTVLTTETTLFNTEDTLVQVRLARFQSLLNLYKALGGGWTQPPGPIAGQTPPLDPGRVLGGFALPVGGNVR